jgi:hypothetical protein
VYCQGELDVAAAATWFCKTNDCKQLRIGGPYPGGFRKVIILRGLHNFTVRKNIISKDLAFSAFADSGQGERPFCKHEFEGKLTCILASWRGFNMHIYFSRSGQLVRRIAGSEASWWPRGFAHGKKSGRPLYHLPVKHKKTARPVSIAQEAPGGLK